MSLRVPFFVLPEPNKEEILYSASFSVVNSEITSLISKAQVLVSIGRRKEAFKYYKAITYLYILIDYFRLRRLWLERRNLQCNPEKSNSKFKVNCVRDNIVCLSRDLGINLLKVYNELEKINNTCNVGEFADYEFRKPGFVD